MEVANLFWIGRLDRSTGQKYTSEATSEYLYLLGGNKEKEGIDEEGIRSWMSLSSRRKHDVFLQQRHYRERNSSW